MHASLNPLSIHLIINIDPVSTNASIIVRIKNRKVKICTAAL